MKRPKVTPNGSPLKMEQKSVKHVFTLEERDVIGGELARSIGALRGIENEFEQVKASYKARTAEGEARLGSLETARMNGFEMRQERCEVFYAPKERKKYFFIEGSEEGADPVLAEEMTNDDFQSELIQAESKFEQREEIPLFQSSDSSKGIIAVGRLAGRWYTALRINVARQKIEERLDSEQKSVVKRADAVREAARRAFAWLTSALGKDSAKGFEAGINEAVKAQEEREE